MVWRRKTKPTKAANITDKKPVTKPTEAAPVAA